MKILLLSNKSPWPPMDGGSSATMSMIRGLAGQGAAVTVLSFNTLKHFADISKVPSGLADFHFTDIDTRLSPSGLIHNLLFSDAPYTMTRFRSEKMSEKLTGILSEDYDIVQIEGLPMTCYLPEIRRHSSAKIIYRPHNIENIIWSELADEEINPIMRLYFRITASRTLATEISLSNSFDAVVAISPDDKEWFIKNGCKTPLVVSVPSPPPCEIDEHEQIPLSVVFIGALDWRPNISGLKWLVNKVWPLVINTIPEARLFIAGRNPGSSMKNICKGRNIIFKGETGSSGQFIADKNVMAVPLFSGSGIRMKIIEGMNHGKPIVATPAAAAGLIFENRKDIFIESDATDYANRIIELLGDIELRNKTGMNARENVRKNYNILASSEELMKFYTRLIR